MPQRLPQANNSCRISDNSRNRRFQFTNAHSVQFISICHSGASAIESLTTPLCITRPFLGRYKLFNVDNFSHPNIRLWKTQLFCLFFARFYPFFGSYPPHFAIFDFCMMCKFGGSYPQKIGFFTHFLRFFRVFCLLLKQGVKFYPHFLKSGCGMSVFLHNLPFFARILPLFFYLLYIKM